ncbi:MAG: addiction module toxin RelE [Candidatus Sumerlaeaceae bacterium]|nr:addiction module toxin RelE [Candidatus Sumerlaeaceae bacterium]
MSKLNRWWEFVETNYFQKRRVGQFATDEAFRQFQNALLMEPEIGAVISGTGGLRKVRWADPGRGKGKRGGIRIIYLLLPAVNRIYLLDAYGKDEKDDLSPRDRKLLAEVVRQISGEATKYRKGRHKL